MVSLRLEEMPTLFGELENDKMTLTRSYEFAASHRLDSPALSPAENVELFGKCNNAAGHGHNYILEVTVEGQPDEKTGMMVDLEAMDSAVNESVVDRYDHKNFNEDLPEFAGKMTTSEVIAQEIFNRLQTAVPAKLNRIRLWETARNMFEVSAS
jgi:6-pyruvoyltetrahydropterin/6-carboxytetrahydropterin synthase